MMNLESDDQNIPKGLDDLLDSIRGESKRQDSSALALYTPDKREEDLVSEQIDERILALLGLEDVVDIDYSTYKTLLREKMMEGRATNSKIPSEETEVLTDEFKRVKRNTGRFKVKREKVKFETLVDNVRPQPQQSKPKKSLLALPGTAQVESPDVEVAEKEDKSQGVEKFLGGMSERLEKIEKNLSDMLDMEAKVASDEKKEAEAERITGEKTKKRKRESALEKGIKGFGKSIADKVTKPVKGFFETLLNFFIQIFLGSAVLGLIKLLQNPMMIFNPLINLVNGVIGMINNILNFLFGGLVGPVNNLVGILNGGITNLENTINGVMGLFGQQEEEEKIKLPKIPEAKVPQIPTIPLFEPKEEKPKEEPVKGMTGGGLVINEGPTFNVKQEVGGYSEGGQVTNFNLGSIGGWKGGNMTISPRVSGFKGGGEIKPTYDFLSPISNFAYAGGGSITSSSGQTITGMGPDTQLIAAQPGEVVMSKKAVQAYGANNLLAMNKNAGGTNIPTMGSVQGFQNGGLVSSVTFSAGHAPTRENYNKRNPYGADGGHVQGTADTGGLEQGSSYLPGGALHGKTPTGVNEYEATMQLVDTMKSMVEGTPLADVIKFKNIETFSGLSAVPRSIEEQGGQFVDIHFDARGFGKAGVIQSTTDNSAVDRALAAQYGSYYGTGSKHQNAARKKGVTNNRGTLLEMARIDDPAIRPYLLEVAKRERGPATMAMARQLLLSTLNGIEGGQELKQHLGTTPGETPQPSVVTPNQPLVPGPGAGESAQRLSELQKLRTTIDQQRSANTGSGQTTRVPGVGSFVQGTTMFGMLPVNKYFNISGEQITKTEFDNKFEVALKTAQQSAQQAASVSPPTTPPKPSVVPPSQQPQGTQPPPPPVQQSRNNIGVLPGPSQSSRPSTSATSAGQKEVPFFSSRDMGNTEFIVIKSIYNIVG